MEKYSAIPSEDLFITLFSEVFGPEKLNYLYEQYPFVDIYHNERFADFVIESGAKRIAIEIDGEAVHNSQVVSADKFDDDQLKQNSMVSYGWTVYRWSYRKLRNSPDTVKDEILLFLGDNPRFTEIKDYLPKQSGGLLVRNITLREYQQEALSELASMRAQNKTIALIAHATGTGKTVTAVSDYKSVGGRCLFLAHTKDLVYQPESTFRALTPEKTIGYYVDGLKQRDKDVVLGSIQSVALNLDDFRPDEFDYIVVDEAHHAATETYQKVISYFQPKFMLGLTATPERADGQDILDTFCNVAHRVDIKTAVETGRLVPVRCIRIKTNIDISGVRYNGIKYNFQDLEQKIYVPERNKLIVDTCLTYAADKHCVIFCVSVKHAEYIAGQLKEAGVAAEAVSGAMSASQRKETLAGYENGKINVLCACDLLNEGWDSPKTDVLFMARPTMSKVLYTQQLGRGMRLSPGKTCLMVFDFVDNSNMYNAPYSLHRLVGKKEYRTGGLVVAPPDQMAADEALYARGERPDALIDYPVFAMDYELVDIFNWQTEAEGMISQMEFVRRVDVQSETIDRYISEKRIIPDLIVPAGAKRKFCYFKEETVNAYAKQFGWTIIDDSKKKDMFLDMVSRMDMSYSYKPVFLKAVFAHIDGRGRVKLEDIVNYFKEFYGNRKQSGLPVEKPNSLYCKETCTDKEVERNILANPFRRFEEMSMMRHSKTLGIIELDRHIYPKLTAEDIQNILTICDQKLTEYYSRKDFRL